MPESTLFGYNSVQLGAVALALLAPAFGYATLLLLGLELTKIPWVKADHAYQSPAWLLPVVASGLTFAVVAFFSASITLHRFHQSPWKDEFLDAYHNEVDLNNRTDGQKMPKILETDTLDLNIEAFEVLSDVRVFVNNSRVFGTHFDCRFAYQCLSNGPQ